MIMMKKLVTWYYRTHLSHPVLFSQHTNSVLRKPTDFDRSFDWTTTTHLHLVISTSRDLTTMMCLDVSHLRSKLKFRIGISEMAKWNGTLNGFWDPKWCLMISRLALFSAGSPCYRGVHCLNNEVWLDNYFQCSSVCPFTQNLRKPHP